jgi:PAS domain S-box-containing protein
MEDTAILDWGSKVHPEDQAGAEQIFLLAFQNRQPFRNEYRVLRHDGVYRWILNEAQPHFSPEGEFLGYIGGAIDIQDKKMAELALRDSEKLSQARYEALLDTSPGAIVVFDSKGKISYANQQAALLFGVRRADLEQLYYNEPGWVLMDTQGRPFGPQDLPLMRLLARREAIHHHQMIVQSPGGQRVWLSWSAAPLFDAQGEIEAAIFTFEDITFRKNWEQGMQQSLEQEKSLNELKGRFLSMISHEFRTPLSVIMTSVEILRRHGMEEGKWQGRLERITTQVNRLNRMLSDITHVYKGQVKNVELQAESLDLAAILLSLREDILATYPHIDDILLEISGHAQNIQADEDLIHQMLVNLLSNAAKYSGEGRQVELYLHYENEGVDISVQDHGIGIPAADRAHLFELFYRGSNTSTTIGTGLGLIIVKNAVEAHNGRLSYESQEGVGTRFRVWLPFSH